MPNYRSCRCSELQSIDESESESSFYTSKSDQIQSCKCTDCKRSCASSFIAFLQRLLL